MSTDTDRPTEDGISIFSTLEAFKNGLTSTLSRPAAADVCRGWMAKIEAADRPDLNGIRDGLRTLARQLDDQQAEGTATAADVGRTMEKLGAHTAESADTIDEDHLRDPLRRLGGYLKAAGIALAGGSRPDEIEGVSTERGVTPGDPELRTVTQAPDLSEQDAGGAGTKGDNFELSDDVYETRGDETPGTALNPQ